MSVARVRLLMGSTVLPRAAEALNLAPESSWGVLEGRTSLFSATGLKQYSVSFGEHRNARGPREVRVIALV